VSRGKKGKPSNSRAIAIGVCGAIAVLALLSWFVPQRTITVLDTVAAKLDRGPASYFHHFYDPDGLLGQVGKVDLDLDTFQRETSHVILVAAFPSVPGNDPDFTMNVAEKWRPGTKGADNGLILFVFTKEHRIRAEVGYGLEAALPDAEMERILAGGPDRPVTVGRTAADPIRVLSVERDRTLPVAELIERTDVDVRRVIARLRGLNGAALTRRGLHPVRGEMTLAQVVNSGLATHLEDHAVQLDGALGIARPEG